MIRMLALLLMALSTLPQETKSDPYCENMIHLNNEMRELRKEINSMMQFNDEMRELRKEIKNMSAEILELKEKNKNLSTSSVAIAFQVHFSRLDVNVGESDAFKLDVVVTNIGNGYNPQTGVFTAPESGIYILYLNIMNEPNRGHIEAALSINGSFQCYARAEATTTTSGGVDDGFCSTVTHLSKGHMVFARRIFGGTYVHGGVWTSFGGTMVYADN